MKRNFMVSVVLGMCMSCALCVGGEVLINNRQAEKGVYAEKDGQWTYSYKTDLVDKKEAGKELHLSGSWKRHPQYAHIAGYNGDILLRIKAPGRVTKVKASSLMTNHADSAKRTLMIGYSVNGVDFQDVAVQEFVSHGKPAGEVSVPENHGRIWLKFSRKLDEKDNNGKYGYVVYKKIAFELSGKVEAQASAKSSAPAEAPAASESHSLKKVFPTGVFWPWERTQFNADIAGMELWAFVDWQMKQLKEHGCSTLWFVNLSSTLMPKILLMAEKNGLKALLNTEAYSVFYHGCYSLDSLKDMAEYSANQLDYPALEGYILQDEPALQSMGIIDLLYRLMKEADPKHDSVAVVMNRPSPSYLRESALPVVCTDLYYFGHDRSTNLPNPVSVSQQELTWALDGYNTAAELYGKHSWFMGQMFGDIWGRHYIKGDKVIVEPGCYLHWRMPTKAETRWQIWEAVRNGSKGIFFYVLFPERPLYTPPAEVKPGTPEAELVKYMDRNAASARSWKKQWMTEKQMEFDPGTGCVQPGGKPTPQMGEMGKVFKILRPHEQLLVTKKRAKAPVFFAATPKTDCATFDTGNAKRYGVVVNRNLNKAQTVKVLLPLNVRSLKNLNDGSRLAIEKAGDDFQSVNIPLEAGSGVLLEAEFSDAYVAVPLLRETFDQQTIHRVKRYGNSEIFNHGEFGVDAARSIRLKEDGDAAKPLFSVGQLTNFKTPYGTIAMNLNCKRKDGTIYCQIKGRLGSAKVVAISAQEEAVKGNFAHLAQENFKAAEERKGQGKAMVIQDKDFQVPAVVPVGTTSLEFYLEKPYDHISDVTIWFVPKTK